jgi:dihydrodipicolinate synthase/N-acetylneuraminate lyase
MNTRPITSAILSASVVAVPPLARTSRFEWNIDANSRIIKYLETGGVTTLLYGGNAALSQVALTEYADLLQMLAGAAGIQTTVIPSVGPTYGMMMDQAAILREFSFPTAMLLPSRDGTTPAGIASGLRRFVDKFEKPVVLYFKHEGMLDVATIQKIASDGLISCIKYAIVRENPNDDAFLRNLIETVGPSLIVSGMGEQPATVHMRDYGLAGFTSGCVCIAPKLSTKMLKALRGQDYAAADRIRQQFVPLETLRDRISPVRVLHAAVRLAEIADTGPITPFFSPVDESDLTAIRTAAQELQRIGSQA